MGIKHLIKVKNLLKNSDKSFTKTEIRDTLNIDYNTVVDVLNYLFNDDKIIVIKKNKKNLIGSLELFKWKKSGNGRQ